MKVRDAMHAPAQVCPERATIGNVARQMSLAEVGTVIVVDEAGHIAGLVTDRDLAVRGYARGHSADAPVDEVMTHAIVTADVDDDVFSAAATMAARGIRRLPVVDAGKVVGLIALDDVTAVLGHEISEIARAVSAQTDPRHYAGWSSWDAL